MPKFVDLSGQKFTRLKVLGLSKQRSPQNEILWDCLCDCGSKRKFTTRCLKSENSKSCGCLRRDLQSGKNNHQARKNMARCNGRFIPSSDEWYKSAERIKNASKTNNIKFGFNSAADLALYLKDIAPLKCPIFGTSFKKGFGRPQPQSPSVDKIIPSKGYVRGNIQIISHLANRMKNNATPKQLRQFARWVLEEHNA